MSNILRNVASFDDLLTYLGDELDWPIDDYELDDLVFEYDAEELGLKDEDAVKISDSTIKQLRPLEGQQPFGIFFVEFGQKKLPVVVLRRILNALVIKKRSSSEAKRWNADDLIFISSFGEEDEREIAFAHFHKDPETTEIPMLRVLGWDGSDTPLKLEHIENTLKNRLHWPEDTNDDDAWRNQWRTAFRHRIGHEIKTARDLADALAGFARKIRDAANTIMAHESDATGQLKQLHRAFKSALIHDLSEEDFADTYAQTVTYGLLTAAISRTEMSEGSQGTAFTQEDIIAMVPVTNPFLKEMLQEFLRVGGRTSGIDFDELGINEVVELLRGDETDLPSVLLDFGKKKPGEDPVIHFYEDFLAAYNKKLRIKRGVFYTPQPVVSYIVRSVHELLQTEFDLEDGLASTITWGEMLENNSNLKLPPLTDLDGEKETISPDEPFVQILDPATGTATFLVEVIDIIYKHLCEKWKKEGKLDLEFRPLWNDYVPTHLLPRLHGYELMMAPYAVAHMKIGLKLKETGYDFHSEERARIYLTNALEPWVKEPALPDFEALAHEAEAVNEIKQFKRFTVVIGNPPYSGISSNMTEHSKQSIDPYKMIDGKPLNERKLWLQDDYVKFIRKAQIILEDSKVGILGYITNNGFLGNPTFRGMRQSLLESFEYIHVLDLHGNSSKKEKSLDGSADKNVFDIKQGVSIFITSTGTHQKKLAHKNLWGSRESKYKWCRENSLNNPNFSVITPSTPYYLLNDRDLNSGEEYKSWLSIWDCFEKYGTGVVTGRDALTTNFKKKKLLENLKSFALLPEEEARLKFKLGKDARDWKVATAQQDLRSHPPKINNLTHIQYRPFDVRWTYYTGNSRGIYASPCKSTMNMMRLTPNIGLITARSNASSANDHFFVTQYISEAKCGESSRQSALFPLFSNHKNDSTQELGIQCHITHNFTEKFSSLILDSLGINLESDSKDTFCYIYAIFYSLGYRNRYVEFLKIDFPRFPLTSSLELFRELAHIGNNLVSLHLLESPTLDTPITKFIGDNRQVSKVGWTPEDGGTVWLDGKGTKKAFTPGTSGFHPVPEDVWNFHIGGYQVCEKWLKDRGPKKGNPGRSLTDEDITHYHKIVIALTETIRLMAEIDEVINSHGGWPDAFSTGDTPSQ